MERPEEWADLAFSTVIWRNTLLQKENTSTNRGKKAKL
jgi:hypothetical protein